MKFPIFPIAILLGALLAAVGLHHAMAYHNLPGWSVVCDAKGAYSFTYRSGTVSMQTFPTKKEAEEALSKIKSGWEDLHNRDDRFKVCDDKR